MKYIDIRVTALSDEDIKDFLVLLRKISICGNQGMNRTIEATVDGDGSGNYNFKLLDSDTDIDDLINLDENELERVANNDGVFKVYLGE